MTSPSSSKKKSYARLVLLSDTHMRHKIHVPDGDFLVFGGDMCLPGDSSEVEEFAYWFATLPHKHKVAIAGNHDFPFERPDEAPFVRSLLADYGITYLEDTGIEIDGVRFWGSPWQPWFYNWAFNLQRGHEIRAKWGLIPDGVDVLITHGPPRNILDKASSDPHAGCDDLRDEVLWRIKPKLHVFGHLHQGYGREEIDGTVFVNASVVNERYEPVNPIQTHDLELAA